jgi:hypothetical protein
VVKIISKYIEDASIGNEKIKIDAYVAEEMPILPFDGAIGIWQVSTPGGNTYLVYRKAGGDQVKVKLS